MSRVFLSLTIIVGAVAIVIVGVTISASYDHLKRFVPEGAPFYFHLNFNPWNYQGQTALEYFYSNWPAEALDQLPTEGWSFVKNNLNQEMLGRTEEASFTLANNQPIMMLKYKPEFNNYRPLGLNRDKTKNHYRLLDPNIIAFAANPETLNGLVARKISPKEGWSLISLKDFLTGYVQNWDIRATIKPRALAWQAQNKDMLIRPDLSAKMGQFINLLTTQGQDDSERYVYALTNPQKYQADQIQSLIQSNLIYFFPRKIVKMLPDQTQVTELIVDPPSFVFYQKQKTEGQRLIQLPDQTQVTELIVDPPSFVFDKIQIGNNEAYALQKNASWPNLFFTTKNQQIILANNQTLLQQYLSDQTGPTHSSDNLEEFYWQNKILSIEGSLIPSFDPKKPIIINGSIVFQQKNTVEN